MLVWTSGSFQEMFKVPAPIKLTRQDAAAGPSAGMSGQKALEKIWGRICMTCDTKLPEDLPLFARQCEACYKNPNTKRKCTKCGESKIPLTEPLWKQVCGSCYTSSKLRECKICKQKSIKEVDPEWRIVCSSCYQNKENFRECANCKEKTIKPGVQSYLKYCGPCYVELKKEQNKLQDSVDKAIVVE